MSVVNTLPPETVWLLTFVPPAHHSTSYPVAPVEAAHDTVTLVDATFDTAADTGAAGGGAGAAVIADALAYPTDVASPDTAYTRNVYIVSAVSPVMSVVNVSPPSTVLLPAGVELLPTYQTTRYSSTPSAGHVDAVHDKVTRVAPIFDTDAAPGAAGAIFVAPI